MENVLLIWQLNSAAVVRYKNGTVIDLVKVDGSADYISSMKYLAEDAQRVLDGGETML